ncbi:MAG: DUF3299 domain-containing protein [Planctomycetia bacterium]|nr:DUF3299 domain-containing protein [Planctomycetia bacterium]
MKRNRASVRSILLVAVALAGAGGVAAWRIRAALRDRPAPPPAVEIRGKAIDAPPAKTAAPVDPGSVVSPLPPPPGHIASRHTGPKALPFDRSPEASAEYPDVLYDTLAGFTYVIPPRRKEGDTTKYPEQIPEDIRALNGRKVCVVGWILPTAWDEDRMTEFLLMRNIPQCCFGIVPMMNEWIVVTVPPDLPSPEHKLTPTAVEGIIEVGEAEVDGWVQSLYRMKAHNILMTE